MSYNNIIIYYSKPKTSRSIEAFEIGWIIFF